MRARLAAAAALLAVGLAQVPGALAADVSSTPTARPCYRTLKFAGLLFLDQDRSIPPSEVGAYAGVTEPNPAKCGIDVGRPIHRHAGRPSTQELVFQLPDGSNELFVSAGETGLPAQNLIRVLVLVLVVVILVFALLPAILGHMLRPPIATDDAPPGTGGEIRS
jgi:hypothetical protein